jgi:sterol desaturase/sphingolipid hydroxylase (fatty acid hydroxylase superfamily)
VGGAHLPEEFAFLCGFPAEFITRSREDQERRQRKIDMVVAVIDAAIAVPELLNQQAIAALLVWFPPAAWLLDWLFDIQELNVDDNTHLRVILAAQLVIIAMLAVLFYFFIHWLFGEPSERASDQK